MESRHDSDGTSESNASAQWYGWCTGFELYGMKADFGIADIYVDGALHGQADYYSPEAVHGALVYAAAGLARGFHTIEIRKSGTKNPVSAAAYITIDYLKVEVAKPEPLPYKQIVCIGDSITFGANVAQRPQQLYGRTLQHMLYAPVSIHGLSGASIGIITNVLESVVAPRNPDLVLWLAGMNNANPLAELERGLDKLQASVPDADIIAATIPYNTYYTEQQNRIKVYEVKQACANKGIPCVDMYAPTRGNTYINKPEGTVHPNGDGQGVIANLFYRELMKRYADCGGL
jgi:lysophospholipase L1-like esterase